jgi:hypothetical protein
MGMYIWLQNGKFKGGAGSPKNFVWMTKKSFDGVLNFFQDEK